VLNKKVRNFLTG